MIFIDSENNYPRYVGDLLLEHPTFDGTSIPEGWKVVTQTQPPTFSDLEVLEEEFPTLVDGTYVQSWIVRPKTKEEIAFQKESLKKLNEKYGILEVIE